jgi:hypothetical protein
VGDLLIVTKTCYPSPHSVESPHPVLHPACTDHEICLTLDSRNAGGKITDTLRSTERDGKCDVVGYDAG